MDEENILKTALKKTIEEKTGLIMENYNLKFLKRRIDCRMRALNISDYNQYKSILTSNLEEIEKIKKELTIHVTNFFRDKPMWSVLKEKLIPQMIDLKNITSSKDINIWSAGSSSGEEACSIFIVFHKILKENIKDYNFSILGTDFDNGIIEQAKKATYQTSQFNEMDKEDIDTYFDKNSDNTYTFKKEFQKFISFQRNDILNYIPEKKFDIIFCRNTVIYFEKNAKENLYTKFYDHLNNNGFFIMGKTEMLNGPARTMFNIYDSKERIYYKEEK